MGFTLNKRSRVPPSPFLGLAQHEWKYKTLTSSTPTIVRTDWHARSFPARFVSDSQLPLGLGQGWVLALLQAEAEAQRGEQLCGWEKAELGLR